MQQSGIVTLDLHGCSAYQAKIAIDAALRRARGVYRLRIVHGYHGGTALRDMIRKDMEQDIQTTQKFISLLKTAENVLIPTTSGEETTYMFKTPLWPTLEQKIRAMENHFDDVPGPEFFEDKYYLG